MRSPSLNHLRSGKPRPLSPTCAVAKSAAAPKRQPSSKAFTLVETSLAMGIVAFAMLPILGLVPVGLGIFRSAISFTAEAQIVQAISNEILMTDYSVIEQKYDGAKPTCYDDEATLLSDPGDPSKLYSAKVELIDVSAPADSGLVPITSKCAVIEISNIAQPSTSKTYTLIIPQG